MKNRISILIVLIGLSMNAFAQKIEHSDWTNFLQKHVSKEGAVDYKSIKVNAAELNKYLNQFSEISPKDSWSKNETLAYWINAYNAFTVKLIIDNYPLKSIKDIKNPWDQEFIPINGKRLSLNHIEHDILRNMKEPRIHFSIVCASASCPKLQNKAFTSEKLEQQLTAATKEFLADVSKNKVQKENIDISKIFKWFSKDFKETGSIIDFLNTYSEIKISQNAKTSYMDYSWELND
ncbi:DUF547 domain-containing protein [Bizionia myxarmorum]|uniref:DUF547 domain-containing protein n=1 Tax=Bizionia myxarmorum TaxID=291186 RepID=A0A5D0RBU0_9FLAO|nr:DUF547 domain-containing protein [Bizionia myxarmorum]TYB79140.1 DUF547 domain-containing protein [Bizionia myxarmorum]